MPRKIGGFAVGLLALLGFLVLYGLLVGYKYTVSPLLNWIAWVLAKVRFDAWRVHIAPFAFLSDALKDADAYIAATIGNGALRCEKIAVRFFHAIAHLGALLGHLLGDLAVSMLHALQVLRHRVIPRLIHAAVAVLRRLLMKLWKWARHAIAAVLHRLLRFVKWARHVVGTILHRLAGLYKWARHLFGYALHRLAGAYKLLRWLLGQFSRKNLLGYAGMVLHWLGLGWLFARNVVWFMEWLIEQSVQDGYLLLKAVWNAFTKDDLCDFPAVAYDIAVLFEPVVRVIVLGEAYVCRHHNATIATAMQAEPGYSGDFYPTATRRDRYDEERWAPGHILPKVSLD